MKVTDIPVSNWMVTDVTTVLTSQEVHAESPSSRYSGVDCFKTKQHSPVHKSRSGIVKSWIGMSRWDTKTLRAFHYAKDSWNLGITSGGGPYISVGIFRPKFAVPFLTNRFFALIRESGRKIWNDKSRFYWLAQFYRKMHVVPFSSGIPTDLWPVSLA